MNEVMNVNIHHEGPNFCPLTSYILNPEWKTKMEELIEIYSPEAIKDSGVRMKIILTDEIPVFQNPRRLSAELRSIANTIIDKWRKKE